MSPNQAGTLKEPVSHRPPASMQLSITPPLPQKGPGGGPWDMGPRPLGG